MPAADTLRDPTPMLGKPRVRRAAVPVEPAELDDDTRADLAGCGGLQRPAAVSTQTRTTVSIGRANGHAEPRRLTISEAGGGWARPRSHLRRAAPGRRGSPRDCLCPDSSRAPTAGETAAQSRMERSVDVGGALVRLVQSSDEISHDRGWRSRRAAGAASRCGAWSRSRVAAGAGDVLLRQLGQWRSVATATSAYSVTSTEGFTGRGLRDTSPSCRHETALVAGMLPVEVWLPERFAPAC
jgi:hypothetical protein